jgi:histidinol-phosphate aminotransferase
MFSFLRSDLAHLRAYTPPHFTGDVPLDRLDGNESYLDLPPELKQKLAWAYQEQIASNRYPEGSHGELKTAIAAYVNTYPHLSTTVTPEQISVGNGSDELIRSLLIATCLGGEGSILVAEPTFSMYSITAETLGIPRRHIPRHEVSWEIDLIAATAAIADYRQPPVRVVFVVHPNSPTGNALTTKEVVWLRSLPDNILVVIDEAYFEYSQQSLVSELPDHPNWILLRTFSKALRLAAHRVGYAIAHPEVIQALEKIRLPYNLPSLSQAAALVALQHHQELLAIVPQVIQAREALIAQLSQVSALQVWKSQSNFIYLRLAGVEEQDQSLSRIIQEMQAQGTLLRHTGGGLRITIGSPDENHRTLDRLLKVLPHHGK